MIVGICVGSGIFFKVDDILAYTGGNVTLGVIVFIIGAFSIIFGSISLTNLEILTDKTGGMVAYFEDFFSPKIASGFGWYQTFLYYPTVIAVVSWVSGIYTLLLFDLPNTFLLQMLIGLIYLLFFYAINIFSKNLGGHFQVFSSLIKLIPLLGVGLVAFFWHQNTPSLPVGVPAQIPSSTSWGWLAALAPMAFSFDGWPIALTISNEVKDSKKNMPKALVLGPLIVLTVYLTYFLGMTHILGADYILAVGDGAVTKIGQLLLGRSGEKVLLFFVLISVLGVVNGVILGHLRMPKALISKEMLPLPKHLTIYSPKLNHYSAIISFLTTLFWFAIHYLTQAFHLLPTGDISEIAVVFGYCFYITLYLKVFNMYRNKQLSNSFTSLIAPIFAIIGGLVIVIGGLSSNPIQMSVSFVLCAIIYWIGVAYYKRQHLIN